MKNYIDHIVLTVSNAKRSAEFYREVLDWEIIEQKDDYAYLTPNGRKYPRTDFMLVVGEPRDHKIEPNIFDRNRIGLDHFAFSVETLSELRDIESRLKRLGTEMENGGATGDGFGGTAIFCKDPDGMKIEFHLVNP